MIRRLSLIVTVLALSASCRRARDVDLACDQLVTADAERGTDIEWDAGYTTRPADQAKGTGRLIVQAFERSTRKPSAKPELAFGVRAVGASQWAYSNPGAGASVAGVPTIVVEAPAGAHEFRSRCLGCWPAEGRHTFVAGRTDTLRVYLGQATPGCARKPRAP